MKYFKALVFLFFVFHCSVEAQCIKRNDVRLQFQSCTDNLQTDLLYNKIELSKSHEPILIGYKGALIAIKARFTMNPFRKLSYCKSGLDEISIAIKNSPHDIELRYLRLLIQTNIPAFLGMSTNLIEDKIVILTFINIETDGHLKNMVTNFLMSSGLCTEKEKLNLVTL